MQARKQHRFKLSSFISRVTTIIIIFPSHLRALAHDFGIDRKYGITNHREQRRQGLDAHCRQGWRSWFVDTVNLWTLSLVSSLTCIAALQQTYASDPKFKKYTQQVERCLNSFDNVHEWADFIAFLKQLLKVRTFVIPAY